tara:strand:- start:1561 stop:2589 length:1029 start_codon:yes stop_codon:yes gene_type:complete
VKEVNWGIIGLGAVASQFSRGLKFARNAKLLGVASKDPDKLKKFEVDYKISKEYCFNDYESLIKNKNIHIIYISLTTSLHFKWIVYCLKEGKRILVEKPATMNSIEAISIKKKYLLESSFLTEAFMYLYNPQIKKILELIKLEEIGKLVSMESFFGNDILSKKNFFGFKKRRKINPENRLYNKKMGGGAILDLGCYPVSLSTVIASIKSETSYDNVQLTNIKKEIGPTDVDLDSYVDLKFENNFKSTIGVSFTKNLGKQTRIIGTEGELIIEDTWTSNSSSIIIKKNNKEKKININSTENIYKHEIETISQCILDNKTKVDFPGLTIDHTIGNMKIIDKWLN